jgi:predicted RNase H-like nuclease (RuvC/YqgF family)
MDMIGIIATVFGFIGSGYGLYGVVTVKAQRRKAEEEANKVRGEVKTNELDNVQEAIKIWREMAESLKAERDEYKRSYLEVQKHNAEMSKQMDAIRKELTRLTNINSKMVKLLDKITPENLSEMVETIKKMHEN